MRTKKRAPAVSAKLASMFTTTAPKIDAAELARRDVDVAPWLRTIVDTTFKLEDPEGLAAELTEALEKKREALTPGVLRELLYDAPRIYARAHLLYVNAEEAFEKYDAEYTAVMGAMKEAALEELQREKDIGIRNKQITDGDVLDRVALKFPDEYTEMATRHTRSKKTVQHLKHLADNVFKRRCSALEALVAGRKEL